MKLLKAPDPNEPWGALLWVEAPKWHWRFYDADGSIYREDIGPIELQQLWFEIRKPDDTE